MGLLEGPGVCESVEWTCGVRVPKRSNKWAGHLVGLDTLSRVCKCPNWVRHQSPAELAKMDLSERYPKALCEKIAKLVVSSWKRTLNLEWWRYQVLNKGESVFEVQRGWGELYVDVAESDERPR